MINRELPTSLTQPELQKDLDDAELKFISRAGQLITATSKKLNKFLREKFKEGQLVLIDDKYRGIIQQVEGSELKIYAPEVNEDPIKIKWINWWTPKTKDIIVNVNCFKNSNGATSALRLKFNTPQGVNRKRIKWSLYYEGVQCIRGLDWNKSGYSEIFFQNKIFKKGTYRVLCRRLKNNLVETASDNDFTFKLSEDRVLIDIGSLSSFYPPISL